MAEGVKADKEQDFSEWYVQTITRAEMIEYTDVSGCYILRPWSFRIWELITQFFDGEIKKSGVKNAYFPCFVSEKALKAEESHIAGFKPEVAWVTRSGDSELKEPVALRPTSETIMYPVFSKWIRSHRDLPLRLNQWCNVVRWEFKHPVPFLRSREFLWQEGHSAFATKQEADAEVMEILEYYARVYEELLAVPVVRGKKTEKEKFAGGDYTTTVEAFIETNGRAIQAATSHSLGQNFAKIFNINFENDKREKALAWQNSWGLSTRCIGVLIMVHGDNNGLVLPPRVAPLQVVIVPIYKGNNHATIDAKSKEIEKTLIEGGVRAEADLRDVYKSAWKYNYWEMKGVPLRLEVGERDLAKNEVFSARRDNRKKAGISLDNLVHNVQQVLDDIQSSMYAAAKAKRDPHIKQTTKWEEFLEHLNSKNIVLVPFCCGDECEEGVKKRSATESKAQQTDQKFELTGAAKSLCIPLEQPALPAGTKCFGCDTEAKSWVLFGRSY